MSKPFNEMNVHEQVEFQVNAKVARLLHKGIKVEVVELDTGVGSAWAVIVNGEFNRMFDKKPKAMLFVFEAEFSIQ